MWISAEDRPLLTFPSVGKPAKASTSGGPPEVGGVRQQLTEVLAEKLSVA